MHIKNFFFIFFIMVSSYSSYANEFYNENYYEYEEESESESESNNFIIKSEVQVDFCYEKNKIECSERDNLARAFQGLSMFFGTISAISAVCPEPFLTKANAVVFTGITLGTSTISFYISGMRCKRAGINFTDQERILIIKDICRQTGKTFVRDRNVGLGHCE